MKCCLQTSSACSSRPHLSAHGLPALSPVRSCCSRALQQHLGSLRQRQPCSRTTRAGIVCAAGGFSTQTAEATAAVEANTVPTATASAIAAAALRPLPFAALSRVLLTANNSTVFRTALNRRQPVSGPMGLLLFLMTLIAASLAAIRGVFVKKSKSCKTCRGFGLQRCRLCLGSGRVDWAAKLKHFDVCPLCMNKRFTICAECGGHYHRPMFRHLRRQGELRHYVKFCCAL